MSRPIVGSGYGRVVALDGDAAVLHTIASHLPFWWTPSDAQPDQLFHVPLVEMAPHVVRAMELWVAEFADDRVFVHAAVVAFDGRAIVMPGRSRVGKTTLCAELLRQGAEYLSDEYAVLDSSGLVHPYPRPLQLRQASARVALTAEDLGSRAVTTPLPVGLVATLTFHERGSWSVTSSSPAEAVLSVLDNTVCARTRPAEALRFVQTATHAAQALTGERGPAADAAGPLLEVAQGAW